MRQGQRGKEGGYVLGSDPLLISEMLDLADVGRMPGDLFI